ncbi:MAG: cation-translocating P-type ATPase [Armatimonadetes bacterium]|nr:cation-translocating P-type ATPase [Armatimonadota bacterium]
MSDTQLNGHQRRLKLPISLPSGENCQKCVADLQNGIRRIKGVDDVSVSNTRTEISVTFDPNLISVSRIESEIRKIGASLDSRIAHRTFGLSEMDCPDCLHTVEKAVASMPGVLWVGANFAAAKIHVEYERDVTRPSKIEEEIERHGIRACTLKPQENRDIATSTRPSRTVTPPWLHNRRLISTVLAAGIALLGALSAHRGYGAISDWLFLLAIVFGGWQIQRSAVFALRDGSIDMNVLMTFAVIGAGVIGQWEDAVGVVILYDIGTLLQSAAMERTRRSIRQLLETTPSKVLVRRGRGDFEIAPENVRLDEVVIVRPGERIALDGDVIAGETEVNQAPITGESLPVHKSSGDRVYAGSINGSGAIEVRVRKIFSQTSLANIVKLVDQAQAQKAPYEELVDRFARRYTPLVVILAIIIAFLVPLCISLRIQWAGQLATSSLWIAWLHRGLSLLLIACPCALVISTPVAVVAAIGQASRMGALIKGGAYLEQLGRIDAIVYDKTGTLTEGRPVVENVVPLDTLPCNEILNIAGAIESRSEHPLAAAFANYQRATDHRSPLKIVHFTELPGQGIRAELDGDPYWLGSIRLAHTLKADLNGAGEVVAVIEAKGKTALILGAGKKAVGVIVISDRPRQNASSAISRFRSLGVRYQTLLTGDNVHSAQAVADMVGLKEMKANLLPEDKLGIIRELQRTYSTVAMVGDGINDAPALSAANVGVVMGGIGSDIAIEAADVVLMGDNLSQLGDLIRLSRRTLNIIRQNVAFSLVTKGVVLAVAVIIPIPLWIAVMSDTGVSLLVTTNALRLIRKMPSPA